MFRNDALAREGEYFQAGSWRCELWSGKGQDPSVTLR